MQGRAPVLERRDTQELTMQLVDWLAGWLPVAPNWRESVEAAVALKVQPSPSGDTQPNRGSLATQCAGPPDRLAHSLK